MHSIDIDVQDENIVVVFEVPGVREEDVHVEAGGKSIRVVASRNSVTDKSKGGNIDINMSSVYYDKTAILPEKADMKNVKVTFFAGLLETSHSTVFKFEFHLSLDGGCYSISWLIITAGCWISERLPV